MRHRRIKGNRKFNGKENRQTSSAKNYFFCLVTSAIFVLCICSNFVSLNGKLNNTEMKLIKNQEISQILLIHFYMLEKSSQGTDFIYLFLIIEASQK